MKNIFVFPNVYVSGSKFIVCCSL